MHLQGFALRAERFRTQMLFGRGLMRLIRTQAKSWPAFVPSEKLPGKHNAAKVETVFLVQLSKSC